MKGKVKWPKRLMAGMLTVATLAAGVVTVNADVVNTSLKYASVDGLEYAVFPAANVNLTQLSYGTYSHSGKNVNDMVPSGRVFAPFSGTIRYIDKSWGYVILESDHEVVYADGRKDYMCLGVMHDNNINDLWVGKHINQGEAFYDKGTKKGSGGSKITGAHVHVIVMRGAFTKSI